MFLSSPWVSSLFCLLAKKGIRLCLYNPPPPAVSPPLSAAMVIDICCFQSEAPTAGSGQSGASVGGAAGSVGFGGSISAWPKRAALTQAAAVKKKGPRNCLRNLRAPALSFRGWSFSTPWWTLSSRSWSLPGGKVEEVRLSVNLAVDCWPTGV